MDSLAVVDDHVYREPVDRGSALALRRRPSQSRILARLHAAGTLSLARVVGVIIADLGVQWVAVAESGAAQSSRSRDGLPAQLFRWRAALLLSLSPAVRNRLPRAALLS